MKLPKSCLDCGDLTTGGSRCDSCKKLRGDVYDPAWRRLSERKRADEPWCHCQGCNLHEGPCPATNDLQLDHTVPVAKGGTVSTGTTVLCGRCNASKRDRMG